ncbi:hypothetical protein ES705_31589 [subsurface metagenome]
MTDEDKRRTATLVTTILVAFAITTAVAVAYWLGGTRINKNAERA